MKNSNNIKNSFAAAMLVLCCTVFHAGSWAQNIPINQQMQAISKPSSVPGWIDLAENMQVNPQTFFAENAAAFGLTASDEMRIIKSEPDELGFTHYRYQQYYNNHKVITGNYMLHVKDGYAVSCNGKVMTQNMSPATSSVSEQSALNVALSQVASKNYYWLNAELERNIKIEKGDANATWFPKGELVYMKASKEVDARKSFYLCWKFDINVNEADQSATVFVDANTDKVINKLPLSYDCSSSSSTTLWNGARTIYTQLSGGSYRLLDDCQTTDISTRNGNGNNNGSGWSYYTDADGTWGTSANQEYQATAHWAVERTYNYYKVVHNRTSYDNAGQTMISYLNPGFTGNAYFTSSTQAASFGGSSTGANPYITLDVGGHEHTHGVTEHTSGLVYQDESGALNESISDIFGEMVESAALGNCDWIHRAEIGGGNRSFINPNSKGQPDTYLGTNWYTGSSDNGGVHTNSGVQNYWFYLLSNGGTGTNDNGTAYDVTAIGRFEARDIYYRAQTVYLNSGDEYIDARYATLRAAYDLYGGSCSNEIIQVGNAWRAVGVESQSGQYNKSICGTYPAAGTYAQAIHQLTVSNGCATTITASATAVSFSARDRVLMYPGFRALSGSNFRAYIEPCAITLYKSAAAEDHRSDAEKGLKTLDETSAAAAATATATAGFDVTPNPFKDAIEVSFNADADATVKISLIDALGKSIKVLDDNKHVEQGVYHLNYSTTDLKAGIYFVNVAVNGVATMKKIIKVD